MKFLWVFCAIALLAPRVVSNYQIPNVNLELTEQGFRVSIPDSPGLQNVFVAIRADDKCTKHFDLLSNSENRLDWTHDYDVLLSNNDKLEIILLVQVNSEIYASSQHLVIENNSVRFVEASDNNKLVDNDCTAEAFQLALGEKPCNANVMTQVAQGSVKCVDDLLFEDHFSGSALNGDKWTVVHRILQNDEITNEFVVLTNSANNLKIANSVLEIKPTLASGNIRSGNLNLGASCNLVRNASDCSLRAGSGKFLPPVYSAMIESKQHFAFQYGRIEIRAKLPRGDWLIPYMLLEGVDDNPYYPSQIRIAFARGNLNYYDNQNKDIGGNSLYGGVSFWQDNERRESFRDTQQNRHFGSEFRVYSLVWKKDAITVLVDGVPYGVVNDDNVKNMIFGRKFFIKLGVSAGGHLEFPDIINPEIKRQNKKPWINTSHRGPLEMWKKRADWKGSWQGSSALQVDYVRVYAV